MGYTGSSMAQTDSAYRERLRITLSGLVPLVFLERQATAQLRDVDRMVTVADLFPTDEQREECLAALVMADDLAVGSFSKTRGGKGSLAALARAISYLACAPGGVVFLGHRWEATDHPQTGPRLTVIVTMAEPKEMKP